LTYATSPVVWGEAGTNGQHAYFQMLHQGTDVVPVEFIAVRRPCYAFEPEGELAVGLADQHQKLNANCLAQAQALMLGKRFEEALQETAPTANLELTPKERLRRSLEIMQTAYRLGYKVSHFHQRIDEADKLVNDHVWINQHPKFQITQNLN
jgi:glucose-6-phosphate isomerase